MSVVPAQAVGLGNGETYFCQPYRLRTSGPVPPYFAYYVTFQSLKRVVTSTITLYNPVNANAQMYCVTGAVDATGTVYGGIGQFGFYVQDDNQTSIAYGDTMAINWTADARLGIV